MPLPVPSVPWEGVAAPDFGPGPPSQLESWTNVGRDWGSASDVPILQTRIQELLERDISLST